MTASEDGAPRVGYCLDWERDEDGSPLCYADATAEALISGEWTPVCARHARRWRTRPLEARQ